MSSDMFSESDINVDPAMRGSVPSAEFFCACSACVGVYVPVRVCVNQEAIVIPERGEQGGVVVPRPLRTVCRPLVKLQLGGAGPGVGACFNVEHRWVTVFVFE